MDEGDGRGGRTQEIELSRPHWFAWVWLILMGGVLAALAVRTHVDALPLLVPFVIFVVPPFLMVLYRSWAVLDREAGTIAVWRRLVVPWRARTIAFEGEVRVDLRTARARDSSRVVGDVFVGGERLAVLSPERARQVAAAIKDFFGAPRSPSS